MSSLSYESVSITPSYSEIENNYEISLSTKFSKNISLSIPIASSPQITDDKLAIAMAKHGGIGIIHRNCSIDEQSSMVKRVKNRVCYRIDHPYTITGHHEFNNVREMGAKLDISIFPIINPITKQLVGVMDLRNYEEFIFSDNSFIEHYSTNNYHTCSPDIDANSAYKLMKKVNSRYLVIVDNDSRLKGMIFLKDLQRLLDKIDYTVDSKLRFRCGAAIGISDALERARALIAEEVDVLVLDNPHAHHRKVLETLKSIKDIKGCPDIVVGDVYTTQASNDLIKYGADGIKVGTFSKNTSMLTGIEIQQLDSLMKCSGLGVPLIADGDFAGLVGNMFKALSVGGANCCMVNKMLLGTKESMGELMIKDGKKYKIYKNQHIPFKGFVYNVLNKMIDGIKMSMSYCGVRSLESITVDYTIRKDV